MLKQTLKNLKELDKFNILNLETAKGNIFSAVEKYLELKNIKKTNYSLVPVSGKVIGNEEIFNAIDACLDGWFTEEDLIKSLKKMRNYLEVKYFLTCNSGSSANLLAMSALCSNQLERKN